MKKASRASKPKAAASKPRSRGVSKPKAVKKTAVRKKGAKEISSPRIRGLLKTVKIKAVKKNLPPVTVEPLSVLIQDSPSQHTITDLPFSYNETRLVLMVRDPYWAFAYWDFSADTWNWLMVFREQDHGAKPKLRIHNLDRGTYEDRDVFLDAKNWYLELGIPEASFEVELGILDSQGKFHVIAKSNRVRTPRNGPSDKIDTAWALSDAEMAEIYRLSGGGRPGHASSDVFSSFRRR